MEEIKKLDRPVLRHLPANILDEIEGLLESTEITQQKSLSEADYSDLYHPITVFQELFPQIISNFSKTIVSSLNEVDSKIEKTQNKLIRIETELKDAKNLERRKALERTFGKVPKLRKPDWKLKERTKPETSVYIFAPESQINIDVLDDVGEWDPNKSSEDYAPKYSKRSEIPRFFVCPQDFFDSSNVSGRITDIFCDNKTRAAREKLLMNEPLQSDEKLSTVVDTKADEKEEVTTMISPFSMPPPLPKSQFDEIKLKRPLSELTIASTPQLSGSQFLSQKVEVDYDTVTFSEQGSAFSEAGSALSDALSTLSDDQMASRRSEQDTENSE